MGDKSEFRKRFSSELNHIENKLNDLENDRYYEESGVRNDGYLATNIKAVKMMLEDLFDKIENNKESAGERLGRRISEVFSEELDK